ncbi:DUF742 domain-containing protein [Streptomyces albireticuli]|uniref:DUF742 domain-containing protein n=1 Tax=Streptomyces albireticuli TaxID=1940 RepID=A0A2A2CZ67_9ACTN|nr:DUF742 domain-containing protein [Streptomyces albireticuli]MCD9143138.1 DUF742 domain-containing protein [Streptomyces albireticuli]MCD9163580.1 DUF742 domain-containing protein [Streptomyces albireticuli]MCD9191255.1 DUF742 domain-containing protein [Streptomyces albireticuli]PAU44456.1 hypothetical protein CK936_34805 [Streptomyces albireticuli]
MTGDGGGPAPPSWALPGGPEAGDPAGGGPVAGGTEARWYDDAAGPVVRPYAMTRGRTRSAAEGALDLIAVVIADEGFTGRAGDAHAVADRALSPEHLDIVDLTRDEHRSIAELAAGLDLPVGVVRVLVGDLLSAGLVRVSRPVPPAELPDESILREVIDGLRAL